MSTNFNFNDSINGNSNKYEYYKLAWMIAHGYTLSGLMRELTDMQFEDPEDSDRITTPINELFEEWEAERGFGSEIWPCKAEWAQTKGEGLEDKNDEDDEDWYDEEEDDSWMERDWKYFVGDRTEPIKIQTNEINHQAIKDSLKVLIDNGIDMEETFTVLQALGYTLLDTELFPENED